MKFQNLIYATMVACAFSACSNDDDPNIPDPAQELDATLTVAFNAAGGSGSSLRSTRAGDEEKDNQFDEIKKIGIAVFNDGAMGTVIEQDGLISYSERTKDNDVDTTACVSAKSGKVKVLVVANPKDKMFQGKTNYSDFLSAISDQSIDSESLLMSSAFKGVTLAQGRNTIGADAETVFGAGNAGSVISSENIKVYRNVARIEVPKITINPREGFGKDHTAKFTLKAIYVSKVRSSVMVFGNATAWCPVVNAAADLLEGEALYSAEVQDGNYVRTFEKNNEVNYGGEATGSLELSPDNTRLFVYDNSSESVFGEELVNNATRLVIRGDYEYTTDGGASTKSEDAYWTTVINNVAPQKSEDFAAHCGVLRNVKYLLNVTITGPGSSDETIDANSATLTANLEVVPWGQVKLDENID